jgi:hypothetical protein
MGAGRAHIPAVVTLPEGGRLNNLYTRLLILLISYDGTFLFQLFLLTPLFFLKEKWARKVWLP